MDKTDNPVTGPKPSFGLEEQGMRHLGPVHWNLQMPFLYEHAVRQRQGEIGLGGAFVVNTGRHTGRSPRDKYIVDEPGTHDTVDWGSVNQKITPAQFASLDPGDTAKTGDEVPATDRHPVEVEIAEASIGGCARMTRRKAGKEPRVVRALRLAEETETRLRERVDTGDRLAAAVE